MDEDESELLLPAVSPRSVAANRVVDGMSAMECSDDDDEDCGEPTTTLSSFAEMPSFLPGLMIEFMGYPSGLPAMLVCRAWRAHGEFFFRDELTELRGACSSSAEYLDLPADTKCTISIDFSPDRRRFASTHGDHTVKIVDYDTSKVVATLRGHPRTPWTVKFHPSDLDIVASGCLGFETRIWNVSTERCVYRTEFDRAIISLSFHPAGDVLAVAAGSFIYLWRYASGSAPQREFSYPYPIRCLRFLQQTGSLVIGAVNGSPADGHLFAANVADARDNNGRLLARDSSPRRNRTTFQLMICDFDLEEARQSGNGSNRSGARRSGSTGGLPDEDSDQNATEAAVRGRRRASDGNNDPPVIWPVVGAGLAISNEPRCVLRHALFYNDGGFDISPCGTFLCSCAELWLPLDEQDGITDDDEDDDVAPPSPSSLFPEDNENGESFFSSPRVPLSRNAHRGHAYSSSTWGVITTPPPPPPPQSGRLAATPERRCGPHTPTTTSRRYDVRIDAEREAPNRASLTDDERPTRRRTRSTASIGGEEARYTSTSDSEVKSRRRFEPLVDDDGLEGESSAAAAALSSREQRWLREQLFIQEQLQIEHAATDELQQQQQASAPLFSFDRRRPSLPTPRHSLGDDEDSSSEEDEAGMVRRLENVVHRMAQREGMDGFRRRRRRRNRQPEKKKEQDLAALTAGPTAPNARGKYKPHLVVVSLVDSVNNRTTDEVEGKLLQATALDDHSFSGVIGQNTGLDIVTSVKFSPSASLVLLGHSRGGDGTAGEGIPRVVSAIYRVGDMKKIDTRMEVGDDVNIARFHPDSGVGIVYGTKQGRICKIAPTRREDADVDAIPPRGTFLRTL